MNAARQLCRASSSITSAKLANPDKLACPVCGRAVKSTEIVRMTNQGVTEERYVIPAHPRDEHGERRMALASSSRRPWED